MLYDSDASKYLLEYTSRDAITYASEAGRGIVTWVTVMNGVSPNFSLDQYRKSSAPGRGFEGSCSRCTGSPGTSASTYGEFCRTPVKSSTGRTGRFSSSYSRMRPGPPET